MGLREDYSERSRRSDEGEVKQQVIDNI